MNPLHITLIHLYPRTMSTYGDTGNIICLQKRCEWRGIQVTIQPVEIGEEIPPQADLYFFGGGQDAAQGKVAEDLLLKSDRILTDTKAGVPLLSICGGYQLLGHSYHPADQKPIPGISLFPVETHASTDRMIGDLVITANPSLSLPKPTIVGFENHSGKTYITDTTIAKPLGTVTHGFGNNGSDHTEGCITGSAIGCYLHGSLLPKNPHLADWLLTQALTRINPDYPLTSLEDDQEWAAHAAIVERYN